MRFSQKVRKFFWSRISILIPKLCFSKVTLCYWFLSRTILFSTCWNVSGIKLQIKIKHLEGDASKEKKLKCTHFPCRKMLICVLKYCYMLKIHCCSQKTLCSLTNYEYIILNIHVCVRLKAYTRVYFNICERLDALFVYARRAAPPYIFLPLFHH